MEKIYKYKVINEDMHGNRGKRAKTFYGDKGQLEVGHLYAQLGKGYPGMQRVLSVEEVEE